MLKLTLAVRYLDGRTDTVQAGPATQVAFEREHDCGIFVIATEQRMSHVYWLAWHATKPGVAFDDWLASLESVDAEVEVPGPTLPAPPAGSSPT